MQAEPPKADPPKRKRRWFQFSLRTLMIVVTLLAVPLGYVGWQAKIVRERTWLVDNMRHIIEMRPGLKTHDRFAVASRPHRRIHFI